MSADPWQDLTELIHGAAEGRITKARAARITEAIVVAGWVRPDDEEGL